MIRNVLCSIIAVQVMSRSFSKSAIRSTGGGHLATKGRNYGYMTYEDAIPCFPQDLVCKKEGES
jgi:hypothetical protein